MSDVMKWIGISGSWKATSPKIERDVRKTVRDVALAGNGIVTGGALNVDYQATGEILNLQRPEQIKVFLPTSLSIYAGHYRKRAEEGIITKEQAESLIAQLTTLQEQNPDGLIENPNNTIVDTTTYYGRNQQVVNVSDELIAFQVNESKGTQDAIDRAKAKGIPVKVYFYKVK